MCFNMKRTLLTIPLVIFVVAAGKKPQSCCLCRNLSYCDEKLHQQPFVVIKQIKQHNIIDMHDVRNGRSLCKNRFSSTDNLQRCVCRNIIRRPYICMECCKELGSITRSKIHMMHHTGVKPYFCPMCYQQFCSRKQLLGHSIVNCPGR